MNGPVLEKLVRFQRPEKALPYAGDIDERTAAALFGTEVEEYRAALAALDEQRADAASRLVKRQSVQDALAALPFTRGDRIVAIGESTTADRLSWFELLRTLAEDERPDLELQFENLAISGASTTQVLAALPAIRRRPAEWVFCMLGSNDAQRVGGSTGLHLVSREETLRNLSALRALAAPDVRTRWVWITPTPVDEAASGAFPFFRAAGISWANDDIAALAAALGALPDAVVESAPAVAAAQAGGDAAFIDDGVHPSLRTHEELAVRVLAALAVAP
ncbi:MAG: hypothetical protein J7484_00805 [Microbacterium sp.]|nr:hypothetical protein [Microbacterium sp.]